MNRTAEKLSRREFVCRLAAGSGLLLLHAGPLGAGREDGADYDQDAHYWGYAVDTTKCIGCNACMRACRAENDVPEGYVRTWVERYRLDGAGEVHVDVAMNDDHVFGESPGETTKAYFVPKLCNHCENSVCNQVCPVGASFTTRDGLVLVDRKHCIGCGYCVQACPYGSRYIHPTLHVADKCTLCYHRISRGELPACVQSCPTGARIFGDLKDPKSRLSIILRQRRYRTLRPEMGTHPKAYYLGLDSEVV